MQALDRKLLRDIWHMRGQVLAIGLVIGSGVAVLIMSLSTLDSLNVTTQAYYERYRFADVFANAKRAPDWVARSVAELPGVQTVETRVSRFATLDIEGFPEPVIGRLISIPESGQPKLNRLALQSGRWIQPQQHDEVIVSAPFGKAGTAPRGQPACGHQRPSKEAHNRRHRVIAGVCVCAGTGRPAAR